MEELQRFYVQTEHIFVIFSGHTLHEVFILREGKFKRIPDLVVWPGKYKLLFCS